MKRIQERALQRHSKTKSAFSKGANMKNEATREAVEEQMALKGNHGNG